MGKGGLGVGIGGWRGLRWLKQGYALVAVKSSSQREVRGDFIRFQVSDSAFPCLLTSVSDI